MGVTVFTTQRLQARLPSADLGSIAKKFKLYKESRDPRTDFGRDADFKDPQSAISAKLMHVHLNDGRFNMKVVQFGRTSDTFLIYCQGHVSPNNYLLIDLITNAHVRCRKITFISELADIAEKFRTKR